MRRHELKLAMDFDRAALMIIAWAVLEAIEMDVDDDLEIKVIMPTREETIRF